MAADITAEKQSLRKHMKQVLSQVTDEQVSRQSEAAQRALLQLEQYKAAGRVSIYLSMPSSELQTDLLIRDALRQGKKVFVPYLSKIVPVDTQQKPQRIMDMLCLTSAEEYAGLKRDAWGIPTLPKDGIEARENALGGHGPSLDDRPRSEGSLDLIVVPGVTFDHEMRRLGHGAGYYDSFFTRYTIDRTRPKPFLVGLCLAEQFLAKDKSVPTIQHDWQVDAVIAGDRGAFHKSSH